MTATAALKQVSISIARADLAASILLVTGRDTLAIRAGTMIAVGDARHAFEDDTAVRTGEMAPGSDYGITIDAGGEPVAVPFDHVDIDAAGVFAGFHFAPGGTATARAGGDDIPAINPFSCWDAEFRPACPDPRGMALIERGGLRFWCDIYLLGVEHLTDGTSRCGVTIADGRDTPQKIDGTGRTKNLDYDTAVAIYAHHGKQLLGAEEFFAAALGVTERSAADDDPETTGLDAARTSRFGIMQATGNLWVWGTDGDPDKPRPSVFGGSWISGSLAGSRFAFLDHWPESSHGTISARGRCDHLSPA